jgi:hypothetical protein
MRHSLTYRQSTLNYLYFDTFLTKYTPNIQFFFFEGNHKIWGIKDPSVYGVFLTSRTSGNAIFDAFLSRGSRF